jgi:hypothetical protein
MIPRSSKLCAVALCAVAAVAACSDDTANLTSNTTTSGTGGNGTGAGSGTGAFTGSGGSGGGPVQCIQGLTELALAPATTDVTLDGNAPAPTVTFTASGKVDGQATDIAASKLAWSVARADDTDPGTIANGVMSPYPYAGGKVTVTATDGCATATADVDLFLDVEVGQPTNPGDWAGTPTTAGTVPLVVYPSDETRIPRNLYRTLFQWRSQGYTEFRLTFDGAGSHVVVYTDGVHGLCASANPAAGCWEVGEQVWDFIAGSNAGSTASWTIEALDHSTTPPTVRQSLPITLGFSKQDVKGAIFYWSTTSAGIRRGRISQQDPEDYVNGKPIATQYGSDAVRCVACHVVSRDGKYIAAPTESLQTKSLWVYQVTPAAPPTPLVTSIDGTDGHGFATISPDDQFMVDAYKGKMNQLDRATGDLVTALPLGTVKGTQPDWSPANDEVIFATGDGDAPSGAGLARISFTGGQWGSPTTFLPPPTGKSNLFPMFSPTSDWIAFSQGKGGHGDLTAQLFVMEKNGTTPIEMVNANRVTNNAMTTGQYQNSQPTWAPPGDLHWVAFNTQRAYGVVKPQGTQQIWVAAVDTSKIANGEDPSYPAFRVPFQGLDEDNHRAFWTLDICDQSDGSGGGGGAPPGCEGGQGGGGGGGPGCSTILTTNAACDPLFDCCETGTYCSSPDGGTTYVCTPPVPG